MTKQKQFRLHADQLEIVEAALAQMKVELPTEHDNVALEHICAAYLSGSVELSDVRAAASELADLESCTTALVQVFDRMRELAKHPYAVSVELDKAFGRSFSEEEAHLVVQAAEVPFRPDEDGALKS